MPASMHARTATAAKAYAPGTRIPQACNPLDVATAASGKIGIKYRPCTPSTTSLPITVQYRYKASITNVMHPATIVAHQIEENHGGRCVEKDVPAMIRPMSGKTYPIVGSGTVNHPNMPTSIR